MSRTLSWLALLTTTAAPCLSACGQTGVTKTDLVPLVRDVCAYQVQMLQRHDSRLQYRMHRTDHKGDTLREVIESQDGSVSRVLKRDGEPLSADENEDQVSKLQALVGTSKLRDREKDDERGRSYGVELLQAMPTALRFTMAPQQVPLADVASKQIVVDFEPSSSFHPAGMAQQLLTSVAGRMWINEADHRLLRLEMHNVSDVNLAWGILAKVYTGGTVSYDQRRFQDVYTFTHITMHMKLRELMVKTRSMDVDTTATDFQRLPQSPNGDEAARMLLALAVPTR